MGSFERLQTTTVREFDGGLNIVQDDLNMDTKYSSIETNVYNSPEGGKAKRQGTKFLYDVGWDKDYQTKYYMKYLGSGTYKEESKPKFVIYKSTSVDYTKAKYDEYPLLFTGNVLGSRSSLEGFGLYKLDGTKLSGHSTLIGTETNTSSRYYYIDVNTASLSIGDIIEIRHEKQSLTRVINITYFNNYLVFVGNVGTTATEILIVDSKGNTGLIWDSTIDYNLNGNRDFTGWHASTSICFATFNGILTVWNGLDKPLAIDFSKENPCNFLIDEASGSNALVPVAKYAFGINHYLVAGSIFNRDTGKYEKDKLFISATDAIGTFNDGVKHASEGAGFASNDGTTISLGNIISSNKQEIKGISRYRDRLCIGFDEVTVFGILGKFGESYTITSSGTDYTVQDHTPNMEDVINTNGCISNRTFQTVNSDLVGLDYSGVTMFRRGNINAQINPNKISSTINPKLYKAFIGLTEATIEDRVFSILNVKDNQYLLFIPKTDDENSEYLCFAYTLDPLNKSTAANGAWSEYTGWSFNCGCTTALNEVILVNKTKVYQLGNIDTPYDADFINDPDYPADEETELSGKEIPFEWELPWVDFGDRAAIKENRYLGISSTGISPFTVDIFTDYLYYKADDSKDPQLSMEFVGGDSAGYGDGRQYYGGSRRTNSELMFAYPVRHKIAKLNIHGSSKYKLNINSITFYYKKGNIRR